MHFNRAGVLQQALVFELPTGSFNQLQVSLEGHDGLLPKLDMFWLFRWVEDLICVLSAPLLGVISLCDGCFCNWQVVSLSLSVSCGRGAVALRRLHSRCHCDRPDPCAVIYIPCQVA